jgi:hypothetical protein
MLLNSAVSIALKMVAAGAVCALTPLLSSTSLAVQRQACSALRNIAAADGARVGCDGTHDGT